jgi:hypothetical protein
MLPARANVSYNFLFDLIKLTTPQKSVAKKQPDENSIAASLRMRGSSLYGRTEWVVLPGKAQPPPG